MTGEARIRANRRNAQKSTGPTTDAGKAAVSRNAMKHGLLARDVVCAVESSRLYADFAAGIYADLAPVGPVEEQLVDRIVTCTWRLQRMVLTEGSMFNSWEVCGRDNLRPGETAFSRRFDRRTSEMIAVSRYEASLDRSLGRAYALLERRQARRRGRTSPPRSRCSSKACPNRLNSIRLSRSAIRRIMKSAKRTQCATRYPPTIRLDEPENPVTRGKMRGFRGRTQLDGT